MLVLTYFITTLSNYFRKNKKDTVDEKLMFQLSFEAIAPIIGYNSTESISFIK